MSEGFVPAEDAVSVTKKGMQSPVTMLLSLHPFCSLACQLALPASKQREGTRP